MSLARRTEVEVTWLGVAITDEIAPFLTGVTVADPMSGAVNDLSLDLQDRDGKWSGDWRPHLGDAAEVRIKAEAWLTGVDSINFGTFAHDSASFSGPPNKVSIKCVSASLATGLRRHRKNRKWTSAPLEQMAQDIADAAGLDLYYNAPAVNHGRREQKDQSDLDFLSQECTEAGFALKVGDGKIVIFEERAREQLPPVGTISLSGGHVLGWSFEDSSTDHYGRCRVSCTKARTGKKIEGTFRDPGDEGPTLEVKRAVSTQAEAEAIAKGLLRSANRGGSKGQLTVIGDPGFFGGAVFDLTDARSFDGRYIVTKATHNVTGGYTCTLDVRRVLEGY